MVPAPSGSNARPYTPCPKLRCPLSPLPLPDIRTTLLDRVVEGTQRFRLPHGRPSHNKLLLLSGPSLQRVLAGSALGAATVGRAARRYRAGLAAQARDRELASLGGR